MARIDSFKGYGPETGYTFLTELIAAHDYGTRGVTVAPDEIFVSDGAKCDTTNIQEIFGADCTVALTDPVYPGVRRQQRHGRDAPAARTRNGRYDRLVYLPATAENQLHARAALPARRSHLPLLSEQSDRRGDQPRCPPAVGGLCAAPPGGHPLRRRLRGVHPRPRRAALHLRDRGRARVRDRVQELLEDGGLHRHAVRVHGRAEGADGPIGGGRRRRPARALVPPAVHQVQRRAVHHPEGGRRRVHARRAEAGARGGRLLHGERADHPRRARRRRDSPSTARATRPTSG